MVLAMKKNTLYTLRKRMIVTFTGHARKHYSREVYCKLAEVLEKKIGGRDVTFYIGMYGRFDGVAYLSCALYRKKHDNAKLVFVTPYLEKEYVNSKLDDLMFDEIIYPDLESVPKRFAIVERNRYMVRQADIVIGYVEYTPSNSRNLMEYALSIKKPFVNIFTLT